ncbi:MAG: helix-turn-helix transcriptional regulator [Phycisphaeraceae bacterium]|nr:helix-turn-helix transcriptional regulator [Phycisphaeraceae bacterium]
MATPANKSHRDLFRGSLDVMVLSVLADGSQYGYAIQKQLHLHSGQKIQAGSLYPLLHRLESEGLILATWDKSSARERKWYELTPAGEKKLCKSAADWQAYIARLQGLVLPAIRRIATHG